MSDLSKYRAALASVRANDNAHRIWFAGKAKQAGKTVSQFKTDLNNLARQERKARWAIHCEK